MYSRIPRSTRKHCRYSKSRYSGAKKLGHGHDYRYAHDDPRGVVTQQYAPDDVDGRDYYEPGRHGHEAAVADRVARIRAILRDR